MFNGKLIIILSGLSGSRKRSIAKFIERDFKLVFINIDDYIIPNFNKTELLSNGVKIINWDDIDSYDWEKINEKVLENQSAGVILCGPYFPTEKLKFETDFHIQIKVPKQVLIEERLKYAESNESIFKGLKEYIPMIVNKITYPNFLKYSEKSKIDKYINSKDKTNDEMYDQIAEFLFLKIQQNLNERNTNKKINTPNTQTNISDDDDDDFDYSNKSSASSDDNDDDFDYSNNSSTSSDEFDSPEESIKLGINQERFFVGSDDDM